MGRLITNCRQSRTSLKPLKEAMEQSNPDPQSEWPEWADNVVSTKSIAFSPCGQLTRQGMSIKHKHEPAEVALCKRLSSQAAKIMKGILVRMSDEGEHKFLPFYVCGSVGDKVLENITEKSIREVLAGTFHPTVDIKIDKMNTKGKWWNRVTAQDQRDHNEPALRAWTALVEWLHTQKELHGAVFVSVGLKSCAKPGFGSSFPQLALAITRKGSVVGLCTCLTWT